MLYKEANQRFHMIEAEPTRFRVQNVVSICYASEAILYELANFLAKIKQYVFLRYYVANHLISLIVYTLVSYPAILSLNYHEHK